MPTAMTGLRDEPLGLHGASQRNRRQADLGQLARFVGRGIVGRPSRAGRAAMEGVIADGSSKRRMAKLRLIGARRRALPVQQRITSGVTPGSRQFDTWTKGWLAALRQLAAE